MKNLIIRALTGIVFVGVVAGSTCFHAFSFLAVFTVITALTLWEFYRLTAPDENNRLTRSLHTLGGAYLFIASFLYTNGISGHVIFLPYLFFLMYMLIAELYAKSADPIRNWTVAFFGQAYCAGSFSLLNWIATGEYLPGTSAYHPLFIVALFVFIWLDDTGAYVVGSLLGKHKLFKRISPKKSWEGFYGGLFFALASSQVFAWLVPDVDRFVWLGLSAVVVVFGTWGDLVESLLKRTLGVKDSGHLLPGHGGMLDRFDSVMMAIPAVYIYLSLVC